MGLYRGTAQAVYVKGPFLTFPIVNIQFKSSKSNIQTNVEGSSNKMWPKRTLHCGKLVIDPSVDISESCQVCGLVV